MNDQYTFDAAPYVLGALSPEEREAFEAHMRECAACTEEVAEFAELPALLAQLPADDPAFTLTDEQLEPPAELLPSLLFAVHRERRRRRWRIATASGLVAACVAGLGIAVAIQPRVSSPKPAPTQAPAALTFRPVVNAPVKATATIVPAVGGTEVRIVCTYNGESWPGGKPRTYVLVPFSKDNRQYPSIGDWKVLPDQEIRMTGFTSLSRGDLGRLEIRTATGKPILELAL